MSSPRVMYRIAYDPKHWGSQQQQALQYLDSNRRLIAHLYRMGGGQVLVTRAWIEQIYITRHDGWKWRAVEQLGL